MSVDGRVSRSSGQIPTLTVWNVMTSLRVPVLLRQPEINQVHLKMSQTNTLMSLRQLEPFMLTLLQCRPIPIKKLSGFMSRWMKLFV
jgi:hypothetical protein